MHAVNVVKSDLQARWDLMTCTAACQGKDCATPQLQKQGITSQHMWLQGQGLVRGVGLVFQQSQWVHCLLAASNGDAHVCCEIY
jgi:hypothetical protein